MKIVKKMVACATVAASMVGISACGNSANQSTANGKTVIKIQTFNNFGYGKPTATKQSADLWKQYEKLHPNVEVKETVASGTDDARSAFNTAISSGSNAYDIYAADVAWMPSITAMPDKFVDLSNYVKNNDWPKWKVEGGKAGNKLVGAGADIGPTAICYRKDLFGKAGLPTNRDEVAKMFGGYSGSWDTYFKIGSEYSQKTGLPWYDSMAQVWGTMKNQKKETYVSTDGAVIADSPTMKSVFNQLVSTTNMSSHLTEWSDDWNAAFKSDKGFATLLCPAWIVNNIKGNAGADYKNWDVAAATPGGGSNQGGSWLVVPESSPVKDEAAKLVAWLTAPKQQAAVFASAANFPSSPSAQKNPLVADKKDPFLNDAPVGKIFTEGANAISVDPYIGNQYYDLDSKFLDALNRVDVTKEQTSERSWSQYVKDVKALS